MKRIVFAALFSLTLTLIQVPADAQTEDGVSKTEILLGAAFPQTGPLSPHYQDFFAGANAYFDYLNSKGGIYGRKVRLILRDDSGVVSRAVSENAILLLKEKVFALFNSSPLIPSYLAAARSAGISQRRIPSLAVTAPYSGFSDSAKYPTTFQIGGNQKQEFKTLVYFYENVLGSPPFFVTMPDNDIGQEFEDFRISLAQKITVSRSIVGPSVPYDRFSSSPLKLRDVGVLSLYLRHTPEDSRTLVLSELYPLLVRGSSISSSVDNFIVANSKSRNIYANFSMPLYTDTSDPYIAFFTSVFKQFTPSKDFSLEINVGDSKSVFNYVSQQMYEGANAAYVVAQAISAIGPEPTREALMSFLRTKSKTLSTASFSPIDYSSSSNVGDNIQYIAKYDGVKWVKNSDFYLINPSGTSVKTVTPQRIPLTPNGIPVMKIAETVTTTITCVKGKLTKKITSTNPKCPAGYKKK